MVILVVMNYTPWSPLAWALVLAATAGTVIALVEVVLAIGGAS